MTRNSIRIAALAYNRYIINWTEPNRKNNIFIFVAMVDKQKKLSILHNE